jgi:hypothetical protein
MIPLTEDSRHPRAVAGREKKTESRERKKNGKHDTHEKKSCITHLKYENMKIIMPNKD